MTFKKLIITQLISSIVLSSPISEAAGINRSGVIFDETGQSSTNGQNGNNFDSFDSLLGGGSLGGIPIGGGLIGGGIGGGSGRAPANKSKISGLANGDIGLLSDVVTIGEDKERVVEQRFVQAPAPAPAPAPALAPEQQSEPQSAKPRTSRPIEAQFPKVFHDPRLDDMDSEFFEKETIIKEEPLEVFEEKGETIEVLEEKVEPQSSRFADFFFPSSFTSRFF